MPSTWLGPETLLGGCNDGGLGGVATLDKDGRLAPLLTERRGAMGAFAPLEWLTSLGQPDQQQTVERKKALMAACDEAPKNGVGANELVQAKVESAAVALEASCPAQPSRVSSAEFGICNTALRKAAPMAKLDRLLVM